MGKNFVFISPTFPKTYYQFPQAWKRIGGTSLCIGEDYYDSLSEEMKTHAMSTIVSITCRIMIRCIVPLHGSHISMARSTGWKAIMNSGWNKMQNYVQISISLLVTTKLLSCAIKQNQT